MSAGRAVVLPALGLAGCLVAAGFAYHAHEALRALRAQTLAGELQPMATLLRENQGLIENLQSEASAQKDSGILEFYLAAIRRDGVVKHAEMKQHLDQLAENNAAVVALIDAYSPRSVNPSFMAEARKFRTYASAWRDRWNSVMELFMAGGNYPASGSPFPSGFPDVVRAEILAAR